ncbi:MAG: LuxR C-terminal-related transcriptional regulator [Psychromonas sp.]|nr:LuxR C-terminal-related transcriptional regulator [Psychromonas sp.]
MMNDRYICYFLSLPSIQASLLIQSLEESLDIVISKMTFMEFTKIISKQKSEQLTFIIIDLEQFKEAQLSKYLSIVNENKLNTKEILINSEPEIIVNELVKLPNLAGLFYKTDTIYTMSEGMKKILNGELWLSRKVSAALIELHRKEKSFTSNIIADLTRREEEIMKLLLLGASNSQIAEQLFVSENTVKTHLYNIFKKIKVKNRLQAVMWAKGLQFRRIQL